MNADDDYYGYMTGSDELWKYGSFEDIMADDRIDEKFFVKKPKPKLKTYMQRIVWIKEVWKYKSYKILNVSVFNSQKLWG